VKPIAHPLVDPASGVRAMKLSFSSDTACVPV
jgi:hypothetical protein